MGSAVAGREHLEAAQDHVSVRRGIRIRVAALVALVAIASSVALARGNPRADPRPNVIVIVTEDQTADSIPNPFRVMPFLQSRALDPSDHWIVFENGYVNTPLCCPSRATMLTGRFAHHTRVQDNDDATLFDERSTLATWLDAEGYHTGLVGKYLNGYPFGRPPYVPPGWERWWGKRQGPVTGLYYDYTLIEFGRPITYGHAGSDHSTDVLASKATTFIREAPLGRPFFLWFAPIASHPPWIPAPRHAGRFRDVAVTTPPSVGERDVSDKPAWVRALAPMDAQEIAALRADRRRSYETLRGVDDAVRQIMDAVTARGDLERTVVVFTSDNGLAFGEHRWTKKSCPYGACLHVPFLIRVPGVPHRTERAIVSAVDLAPTIAELATAEPVMRFDGVSLVPLLETGSREGLPGELFAEFVGSDAIPAWWEIRTPSFAYIELATGEHELYALRSDPHELVNVAHDPRFAAELERLAVTLERYRST